MVLDSEQSIARFTTVNGFRKRLNKEDKMKSSDQYLVLNSKIATIILCAVFILIFLFPSYSQAAITSNDSLFYKSEGLRLHRLSFLPAKKWCNTDPKVAYHEVSVFYDVPHLERLKRMGSNYVAFVKDTVIPAIQQYCGVAVNPKNINIILNMYQMLPDPSVPGSYVEERAGSITPHWDTMMFVSNQSGVLYSRYIPKAASQHLSQKQITALMPAYILKQIKADIKTDVKVRKAKEVWVATKCHGAFCDLPGGIYLNAIYNNDIALIKKLDKHINAKTVTMLQQSSNRILGARGTDLLKKAMKQMNKGGPSKIQNKLKNGLQNKSMLRYVADYYMYHPRDFNPFSMICKEKLVTKVKIYKGDTYDIENSDGLYIGQGGGETTKTAYNIKPNFSALCDRVCSHMGGDRNVALKYLRSNSKVVASTLKGVIQLRSDVKYCKKPELKKNIAQFERNLISLTNQYLDSKATWISGVK